MRKNALKPGLSIVELIIAISIFSILGLMAVTIFVNVTRMQGRIALENAIYEDARFMMSRISREIRNNAVDYEEYFNQTVGTDPEFGDLYGCYAAMFYDPGKSSGQNLNISVTAADPGSFGAFCGNGEPYTGPESCTLYRPSLDENKGEFPYEESKAFNDNGNIYNAFKNAKKEAVGIRDNLVTQPELYLISRDGKQKTLFARKQTGAGPDEYALGMLKLRGDDPDNNGITDIWTGCGGNADNHCCAEGFDCPAKVSGGLENLRASLAASANLYQGFIPISPLRTNITDLRFIIKPLEDPRKAFAELDNREHPRVTIWLTVEPSDQQKRRYGNPDNAPALTLQTTVSPRIQTEVESYLGAKTQTKCGPLGAGLLYN